MSKKYFVFVSSTREDLKAERREIIRIVSELGAVPVTLEAFNIANEEDRRIIRKAVEECDYFINLTAHRAGEEIGKSYALEIEYSWALKAGIPVLALIIGEKARWKASKKDKDENAVKALAAFKKKLEGHTFDTWVNLADLRQKALAMITREMNLNPRCGWVPSSEAADPLVANELGRLIRENEILRSQIKMDGEDIVKKVQEEIKKTLKLLAVNRISISFYYKDGENWENTRDFRYLRLFKLLAPELSIPRTTAEISHFLGNILNPDLGKTVRKDFPAPSNTIKKIMSDLGLLKLVKCTGTGDDEAWEMSEFGKESFAVFRLHQMRRPLARDKNAR